MKVYECDACGACCRHLIIEIEELDILREPRLAAVSKPFKVPEGMSLTDENDEPYVEQVPGFGAGAMLACGKACPMLDNNKCSIYPTRPNCCVAFRAGSEQCQEVRGYEGLPPLIPLSTKKVGKRSYHGPQ